MLADDAAISVNTLMTIAKRVAANISNDFDNKALKISTAIRDRETAQKCALTAVRIANFRNGLLARVMRRIYFEHERQRNG